MKFSSLLTGVLTIALCLSMGNLHAQKCQKTCSKAESRSAEKTAEKRDYQYAKRSCTYKRSYTSSKNKKAYADTEVKRKHSKHNFIGALVGIATIWDSDQASFTTGLGYEHKLNSRLGLGLTGDVSFGDNTDLRLAIPISLYANRRVKLFAGPVSSFNQQTVVDRTIPIASDETPPTTKEWNTNFGARVGLSYQLTTRGLRLAPTVITDYIDGQFGLRVGLMTGLGF